MGFQWIQEFYLHVSGNIKSSQLKSFLFAPESKGLILDRTLTCFKILLTFSLDNSNFILYLWGSSAEKILLSCQFLKCALLNPVCDSHPPCRGQVKEILTSIPSWQTQCQCFKLQLPLTKQS